MKGKIGRTLLWPIKAVGSAWKARNKKAEIEKRFGEKTKNFGKAKEVIKGKYSSTEDIGNAIKATEELIETYHEILNNDKRFAPKKSASN